MIEPARILCRDCVLAGVEVRDVKALLQRISGPLAEASGLEAGDIAQALLTRERCGSTGFGRGAAIPHARLAGLDRMVGLVALLTRPIDFGAVDGRPVDIVFALLSPESAGADHLRALAAIGRLFRDQSLLDRLRGTSDADAAYAVLANHGWSEAA